MFAVSTSISRSGTFDVRQLSFLCSNQIEKYMQIGIGFFQQGLIYFLVVADGKYICDRISKLEHLHRF